MATAPDVTAEIYTIDLEALPIVDDIPDDFFEDFEKNDFLDGFEVLDDLSPTDDNLRKCLSALSSASSKFGLDKNQTEIKELEEENVERRHQLCDTRSPLRSSSSRTRSLSRHRRYGRSRSRSRNRPSRSSSRARRSRSHGRRSRTRSRGRRSRTRSRGRRSRTSSHGRRSRTRSSGHRSKSRGRRSRSRGRRIRLRSRDRRPKSRGRPSRSPIELPSLSRRPKSKSRDKGGATGVKTLSFLEELSQKFAEQGKAFPEAEAFDINAMNNYEVRSNPFDPFPLYNQKAVQPSEWLFNNVMSVPRGTKSMIPTSVAMDLESSNSNSREAPPPPSIVKPEYENYNSRFCDTEEIIRKTFREAVITRCRDVVNLLKAAEAHLFEPQTLQFIPTVISASLPNGTKLSPFQTMHNVEFSFNNVDKTPSYIKRLSKYTSSIVRTLGFNMKTAQFPVQNSFIDDSDLLPDDTIPIKFDIGAQTEPVHCVRCLKHDMREVEDKTTQVAAITYHIACQTSNEDMHAFSDLTPAQLIAMNDFAKILKTGLTPTNYREATDLRDRLFNIYQTCTDFSKKSFMHDTEKVINPAIFRDIDERVPEPVVDPRMVHNNIMIQQDFDNRQMNIDSQRHFEQNRTMDRGDKIFSRPLDLFQPNNIINSTINSQDRFIQTQNKERFDFDLNIQQGDQFSLMRNSDPRCTQQQQLQNLNDFGANRMTASMNVSPNLFDSTQDCFTNILMNQQQQLLSNIIWGHGSGGALSSLSSISANLRGQAPQPLLSELVNGNTGIEPGPNLQSINQENNLPFDNDSRARKKKRRRRRVRNCAKSRKLKIKLEEPAKSK